MLSLSYILLGAIAGICSGFFGLGGAFLVIPALVNFYGYTQHDAQGTALAMMVPPITIFAAYRYYQNGHVKIDTAIFLIIGFVMASLVAANIAQGLSGALLRRLFGVTLLLMSLKMIFSR